MPLPHEDLYAAALSYPDQAPVDAEDWFQATWEADGPRDVMVNVTGRALGLSYLFGIDAPAPVVELEAYGPGDDTPAYEAIGGLDGVSLEFTTERSGTWLFHVSLADAGDEPGCLASSESAADAPAGTYNLYWGCEPHCVVTTT